MRYSANLNIIIKSIEKSTARLPRDFLELENLQTNPNSAIKFANACYQYIKKNLIDDLTKLRPQYNLFFADGQNIINQENSEYSFKIFPIDGFNSLVRGIPDFTIAIALEYKSSSKESESITVVINKPISNDLYYCEKGFGSYLNNKKIKTSRRSVNDLPLISIDDYSYLSSEIKESLKLKSFTLRNYGCRTLDIAYLSSSRFDLSFFKKWQYEYLKPFFLLITEAGGKIVENEKFTIAGNNLILQ